MNNVQKISIIISLIGILMLIYFSSHKQVEIEDIKNITIEDIGKIVAIKGSMISVENLKGFQIIVIQDDTGILKATANSKQPINKTAEKVVVIGKVQEYKTELEIIADKILLAKD